MRGVFTFTFILCLIFASRAVFSDLLDAKEFNAFVFNDHTVVDANSPGDTEGRLAIGGKATLGPTYSVGSAVIGTQLPQSNGSRDDLIVGGDLDSVGGTWSVLYGNTVVGGSLLSSGPTTANGNIITEHVNPLPVDFVGAKIRLTARSAYLSTQDTEGSYSILYGKLTLTGTHSDLNVFNLTAEEWGQDGLWGRELDIPDGSTALINVSGKTISMTGGDMTFVNQSLDEGRGMVFINYAEATEVNLSNTSIEGSILAPNAHLNLTGGSINGQAVFSSVDQGGGGEFHNFKFEGTLPIPEPAVISFITLFGVGALVVRRIVT